MTRGRSARPIVAAALVVLAGCGGGGGKSIQSAPRVSTVGSSDDSTSTSATTTAASTSAASAQASSSTRPGSSTTTGSVAPAAASHPSGGSGSVAGKVIVIDPGHNGDNGAHPEIINKPVNAGGFMKECNTTGTATDSGYSESAFNFAVAIALQAKLQAMGATVILTRTDDHGVGPCIDQRGLTAQQHHADALLSIHADGAPSGGHGFHVIHPGVIAGYTDATAAPSSVFAADVRDALVAAGFTPSTYTGQKGLVTRTDLGTLNRAGVPAAMTELGNMRNAGDAALMQSASGRDRLAAALAAGLAAYL